MFRFGASLTVFTATVVLGGVSVAAAGPVMTKTMQEEMTPDQSLAKLKEGNERFVEAKTAERDLTTQVEDTAEGQYPFAVVLGCIDSRVPPEMVFDTGIGDIFSARIAGNFANTDIIGSIEFATQIAGANLVLVLGHTQCGAVMGACDAAKLGNLTHTLSNLAPAIYAVDDAKGERSSKNPEYVQAVAEENVRQTVDALTERSDVLSGLVEKGDLKVVGAMYDIATGKVEFFE